MNQFISEILTSAIRLLTLQPVSTWAAKITMNIASKWFITLSGCRPSRSYYLVTKNIQVNYSHDRSKTRRGKVFCAISLLLTTFPLTAVSFSGTGRSMFSIVSQRQHCFLRSPTTETTSNHFMRCSASWAPSELQLCVCNPLVSVILINNLMNPLVKSFWLHLLLKLWEWIKSVFDVQIVDVDL